jgi:hypothetical protein
MTLCHFQKVLDFLVESSESNTTEGKKRIALVTDIITFYRARSSIPKSRWKRIPIIWKEFIAFRYQCYRKLRRTIK